MNKFFVSIGLAIVGTTVVGTTGLHAAYAPDASDASKIWSISGTLRGFYDNNYTTGSSGNTHGSYGFEISPQLNINVPLQQTEIGARYIYGLYYYQDRDEKGQDPLDHTHQLDLWLDHAFNEHWEGRMQDSFVVAQEPELLQGGTTTRVEGNNIANSASFSMHTDWTRLLSTEFTFQNKFYDYENSGAKVDTTGGAGFWTLNAGANPGASLAGLLNRDENYFSLDVDWNLTPTTVVLVGYQYGQVNYIGDEPIAVFNTFGPPKSKVYSSSTRNSLSHYVYVGALYNLLGNLSLNGRLGAQYTDNYNDPSHTTSFGPYANVSLSYTYLPGSYAQIGVTHSRNATDEIDLNNNNGSITLDQESTMIFASINHRVTPKLMATLIGSYEYSVFNGGSVDGQADTLYSVGLNFNYAFTRHFSGEVGYNYDKLNSDIVGRSFARDRVYVGFTAAY